MQTGSNFGGKEKMILLTGEANFLLLSNYAEPRYRPVLDWLWPPHPPPCPAPTPPLPRHTEHLLPGQTPRLLGNTDVSTPATSATSLEGETPEITYLPTARAADFLISCRLYLHTSQFPPAWVHSLLMPFPPPGWLTEQRRLSEPHSSPFAYPFLAGGFKS